MSESPQEAVTMFGLFRKRTFLVGDVVGHALGLVPYLLRAGRIWLLRGMDPQFREEIMLAVSRVNGCRYCSYIHHEWALATGVPDDEIARLEGLEPKGFDRGRWVALAWAQARSAADFGSAPDELDRAMHEQHELSVRKDVEAVARIMTMVNRSANTMDALLERLRGEPVEGSRAIDELLVTLGLVGLGWPYVFLLALRLRRSPWRLWREFRAFSNEFDQSTARP